jgi:hypothetical protein
MMELHMSLMGLSMSLMELRTMEHHKSLMGLRKMELRTMGHHMSLMERCMSLMKHIHVQLKLPVSSIEQLGVPEQLVRVQFQQRVLGCIQVGHIELRFVVGHMTMRFRDHRWSVHHDRRLRNLHDRHLLRGFLVGAKFP